MAREPERESRARIIDAAKQLIASAGADAATTRAVADAAGVQAPTIYRLFGDKDRMLATVAEAAFAEYVAKKARKKPHSDPVQDLRDGWDTHVAFSLANPGIFAIMTSSATRQSSATAAGFEVLRAKIHRIAAAGRLRVSEARALALIHSVGTGIIFELVGLPESERDMKTSDVAREMVLSAITTEKAAPQNHGPREAASALKAKLGETDVLTAGERHLLKELLERIANG